MILFRNSIARSIIIFTRNVVSIMFCIWIILFVASVLTPRPVINAIFGEEYGIKSNIDSTFSDIIQYYRSSVAKYTGLPEHVPVYGGNSLDDPAFFWRRACVSWFDSYINTATPVSDEEQLTTHSVFALLVLSSSIYSEYSKTQVEIKFLQESTASYSAIIIALGMLTTILAAMNSSELGVGTRPSAVAIKILAIIFPALVTAVTAYSSLFASPELSSQRSQKLFAIANLMSEIKLDLSASECPLPKNGSTSALRVRTAEWSKKYSEVMAGSESGKEKSVKDLERSTPR